MGVTIVDTSLKTSTWAKQKRLAIIVALTFMAGCSDNTAPGPTGNATSPVESAPSRALSIGDAVPALQVPVLLQADGKETVALDELRGSTVVLEFWATSCGPCIAAIDHLNEIAAEFADRDDVCFISVTGETIDSVSTFLDRKPIHTWIGVDPTQTLLKAFGVAGIPQTILINPDGKVAAKISPSQLDASVLARVQNGETLEDESSGIVIVAGVDPEESGANQALMQFILRESTTPSSGPSAVFSGSTSTLLGYTAEQLVSHVFGLRSARTEFVAELPETCFDLVTRFPTSTDDGEHLVQSAVASAFGVKLRYESRNVDVFVADLPKDGHHLLSATASSGGSSTSVNNTGINVVNGSLANILYSMEPALERPIVDETGLDGSYDVAVTWDKGATPEQMAKAFTDATGLVLTAAKRDIEFAVVEHNRLRGVGPRAAAR
jgi:uncharacterized protein (TIGR03435 family)